MLIINPLNTELNPFCHLLALLGAHHILHVSRVRVNTADTTEYCAGKAKFWTASCHTSVTELSLNTAQNR